MIKISRVEFLRQRDHWRAQMAEIKSHLPVDNVHILDPGTEIVCDLCNAEITDLYINELDDGNVVCSDCAKEFPNGTH